MTGDRVTREDAYVIAYGQLHEIVRRFLLGDVGTRYLRRRHDEIERELTELLDVTHKPTEPTEPTEYRDQVIGTDNGPRSNQ